MQNSTFSSFEITRIDEHVDDIDDIDDTDNIEDIDLNKHNESGLILVKKTDLTSRIICGLTGYEFSHIGWIFKSAVVNNSSNSEISSQPKFILVDILGLLNSHWQHYGSLDQINHDTTIEKIIFRPLLNQSKDKIALVKLLAGDRFTIEDNLVSLIDNDLITHCITPILLINRLLLYLENINEKVGTAKIVRSPSLDIFDVDSDSTHNLDESSDQVFLRRMTLNSPVLDNDILLYDRTSFSSEHKNRGARIKNQVDANIQESNQDSDDKNAIIGLIKTLITRAAINPNFKEKLIIQCRINNNFSLPREKFHHLTYQNLSDIFSELINFLNNGVAKHNISWNGLNRIVNEYVKELSHIQNNLGSNHVEPRIDRLIQPVSEENTAIPVVVSFNGKMEDITLAVKPEESKFLKSLIAVQDQVKTIMLGIQKDETTILNLNQLVNNLNVVLENVNLEKIPNYNLPVGSYQSITVVNDQNLRTVFPLQLKNGRRLILTSHSHLPGRINSVGTPESTKGSSNPDLSKFDRDTLEEMLISLDLQANGDPSIDGLRTQIVSAIIEKNK